MRNSSMVNNRLKTLEKKVHNLGSSIIPEIVESGNNEALNPKRKNFSNHKWRQKTETVPKKKQDFQESCRN